MTAAASSRQPIWSPPNQQASSHGDAPPNHPQAEKIGLRAILSTGCALAARCSFELRFMSGNAIFARPWRQMLTRYQGANLTRSILELVVTAAPLLFLWGAAWIASSFGLWWLALLLAVPAAGFLVRLFMIQHDCSHRAYFKSAKFNDWLGRVIGVFTLTPHDCWRRTHAIHHATSGNLDRRGIGEVKTLTVDEYRALPALKRLGYRLYRHPAVLFGIGPAFLFVLLHRLPTGAMREGWRPWLSALGTNAAIGALVGLVLWLGGWQALVLVHLPTLLLAASIGVWLFFVQHQFEHAYWARQSAWNGTEAALRGSSYYDLPQPLRWMTANIGIHHVHHVSSRIPFYRLPQVLREHPELKNVSKLNFAASVRSVGLTLWDERAHRLISFKEARNSQLKTRTSVPTISEILTENKG
jgi:omega-6 fatty acid desaturase (delta-12 desaturase)